MNPSSTSTKKSAAATASLTLGIVSLPLMLTAGLLFFFPNIAIIPFGLAVVGGLVGFILAIVALVQRGKSPSSQASAVTGLVLSIFVGLVGVCIIVLVTSVGLFG